MDIQSVEPATTPCQKSLELLKSIVGLIQQWRHNRRSRLHLAELSDYQLKDIGISPSERQHELDKPFWR
jgi:uncharacterized protein YjiS (DUF1127 family)